MKNKTTIRYTPIAVRTFIIKDTNDRSIGKDVEKGEPWCTIGENVN
jgi:hypothetical protein